MPFLHYVIFVSFLSQFSSRNNDLAAKLLGLQDDAECSDKKKKKKQKKNSKE